MPSPSWSPSQANRVDPKTAASCNRSHRKNTHIAMLICASSLLVLSQQLVSIRHPFLAAVSYEELANLPPAVTVPIRVRETIEKRELARASDDEAVNGVAITPNAPINAPLVHIVRTRFMQFQPNLLHLGHARLLLFKTFCLPSMLAQTNPNFLWVIRADPDLNPEILQPMIQLLKGHPNFILLGSTDNPSGFSRHDNGEQGESQRSFDEYLYAHQQTKIPNKKKKYRIEKEKLEAKATVFSGNLTLLEEAYQHTANEEGIVLETRLDADDGIHHELIDTIQKEAMQYLQHDVPLYSKESAETNNSSNFWRIWCVDTHTNWHPSNPEPDNNNMTAPESTLRQEQGYLLNRPFDMCVTPGLSAAIGPGYRPKVDLLDRHAQIHKENELCSESKQIECLRLLETLAPAGAIRARTTTSAGMKSVGRVLDQEKINDDLWDAFDFITPPSVKETRQWIVEHQAAIADDNIKGQCTPFHSCKDRNVEYLSSLVDNLGGNTSEV